VARKFIIIKSSEKYSRHLCVDQSIADDFLDFIEKDDKHRDKYKKIADHILNEANIYFELYGKEGYNSKTKNVTAMKFFKGGENARVYCKEISTAEGTFYVIAAKFLPMKKVQKNDKKIQSIVKSVSEYEYEICKAN
jgi:hypothetical protein